MPAIWWQTGQVYRIISNGLWCSILNHYFFFSQFFCCFLTWKQNTTQLLHEYNLPPFLGEIEVAYKKVDTPSIPFDLYIDLCIALDPVDPSGNDWRMLAARLQLSRYINYLKTHYKDGPTSCVLLCWMKQKESMDKLADILEEIKRGDAASLIRNYGIKEEDKEQ